jgi:hypothetical protein
MLDKLRELKNFKKLKFVRKIQMGFLLIGTISAFIAINDFFQISEFETTKDNIFSDYLEPTLEVKGLYTDFQKMQFVLIQLSIPEFADQFNQNVNTYREFSASFDSTLARLTERKYDNEIVSAILQEISGIWQNYKGIVADGIISASASQMYDMA